MANYGFTEHERNWWAARYRQGSALFFLGWLLVWFAVFCSVFVFISVRVGSSFWLWWTGGLGVVGLIMVAIGTNLRKRPQTEFVETKHTPDRVA
jgi:Sec-independent protein secretion pathway component TatC